MIIIKLPLPDPILNPNSRAHWAPKAKAKKLYREAAYWATVAAKRKAKPAPYLAGMEHANSQLIFHFKDRRLRDRDNLLASMKSAFDGIVDSGLLIDDAGLIHWPVIIAKPDKAQPRVIITIWPKETYSRRGRLEKTA